MSKRISARNLEVGQYVKKGFTDDDNLLLTDYIVDSEDELERLKEVGLKYCLVPAKESVATEAEEETTRDEVSLDPEEVLSRELDQLSTQLDRTQKVYREAADELGTLLEEAHTGGYQDLNGFERLNPYLDQLIEFTSEAPASVSVLTQVEHYDEVTLNHSLNVAIYTMVYGNWAGMSRGELLDLGLGSLLHDIGKTRFSRKMVEKDGELSDKEWEVVRKHPGKGRRILSEQNAGEIPRKIASQ
ncbi:MAG: HD-GYP domain-containing protein, partial [bacterium]